MEDKKDLLEEDENQDEEKESSKEDKIQEILDLLSSLEEKQQASGNENGNQKPPRVLMIDVGPFVFKNSILNVLLYTVLNAILVTLIIFNMPSLSYYEGYLMVYVFFATFTVLDLSVKYIISSYLSEIIIASFGFIYFIITLLLLTLLDNNFIYFTFTTKYSMVIFATIFSLARYIILAPLKSWIRMNKINRLFRGKR